MGSKKFAVLHCADDSDYVKKLYGGYFGIFVRMLGEEGETWDVYKVAKEEFPEDNEIGEYDGFVITGSCSDAHGNDLWISKLVALLKKLDAMKKKVLGICFGHQVLSSHHFHFIQFSVSLKYIYGQLSLFSGVNVIYLYVWQWPLT
ncbi:gamma-glutamyl peptidase 5-like [Olea europaea var. sylvestris]|uniref:gamma-glutamyl peptidase 5-like n=1 Tax=Olea europaea var. sylvestris TaxID=158386 RepID=UPI000C1D4CCF|nr:gamma-glutamyl peptidase 5-like [Olea europaea var. sylvestris]